VSHPWKPQPYYLIHMARTTGSVPQPMGFGGVYSRGSFTPKSPWATPAYIASEPTGVHGFGSDAGAGCTPFEQVRGAIEKGLREGVSTIGSKIPAPFDALVDSNVAKIAQYATKRLQALSANVAAKQGSLVDLLETAINGALDELGLFGGAVKSSGAVPVLLQYGSKYLVNIAQICLPVDPNAWVKDAYASAHEAAKQAMRDQAKVLSVTNVAMTQEDAVKALLAPGTQTALAQPQAMPAASGGISPVMIGAAALAALMLLK
jgi:hypothetical protein